MSIITRVQSNPEIGTDNATYVAELIVRCTNHIKSFCKVEGFEKAVGYLVSGVSPSTDISGIDSNHLYISVNYNDWTSINLTLANCTTGEKIATELQTQIQAITDSNNFGFSEVTVTYADSKYTITSNRYGDDSLIEFSADSDTVDTIRALKLSSSYGADHHNGSSDINPLIDACVSMVEMQYRKLGLEGMQSGSIPGGVSFSAADVNPLILDILLQNRGI